MRQFNLRLFVILVVGTAIGAGLIHGLHLFQVHRQSGALLQEAEREEKEGNRVQAVELLRKYLLLSPNDAKAMARLADIAYAERSYREAQALYSRLVQLAPNDETSRRKLVETSLRLRRYQDAEYHLEKFLTAAHPEESELNIQLGVSKEGLGDHVGAVKSFAAALDKDPSRIEAYEYLAGVVTERPSLVVGDPAKVTARSAAVVTAKAAPSPGGLVTTLPKWLQEDVGKSASPAVAIINAMVKRNPRNSDAYLARAHFFRNHSTDPAIRFAILQSVNAGKVTQGDPVLRMSLDDAKQGLALNPKSTRALILAAELEFARGALPEAREFAQRATASDPTEAEGYLVLASVDLRENRRDAAIQVLTTGLKTANSPVLLWTLAGLMIDKNDLEEANKLIERLRPLEPARPIVDYLGSRILISQSKWSQAARQLKSIGTDLQRWPQIYRESKFWLAQCELHLGREDNAVAAYRAALDSDPLWAPARLGLADVLRSMGRIDEAITELRRAPERTAAQEINMLRLEVLQTLSKPIAERDWKDYAKKLQEVADSGTQPDAVVLLAEIDVATNHSKEAQQRLKSAIAKHPDQAPLWSALVTLTARTGNQTETEQLLSKMEQQLGDCLAVRLCRADAALRHPGPTTHSTLATLAKAPNSFSPTDQAALAIGVARAAIAIRDYSQAEALLKEAQRQQPTSLQIPLLMFDLALQIDKPDLVQQALAEVRRIEGDGVLSRYGEALRLVLAAKQNLQDSSKPNLHVDKVQVDTLLKQAAAELAEAKARRPNWTKIQVLTGLLEDLRGNPREAVDSYLGAINQGERHPAVVMRCLALLSSKDDNRKADQVIEKLQHENLPFSLELARYATERYLFRQDYDQGYQQAIELARQTADRTKAPADRIRLSILYQVKGDFRAAEAELTKVLESDKHNVPAIVALIRLLSSTAQKKRAGQMLEVARPWLDQPKTKAEYGYCLLMIGDAPGAETAFRDMEQSPEQAFRSLELLVNLKVGQKKIADAEQLLRSYLKSPKTDGKQRSGAQRALAYVLASEGGYKNHLEAQALVVQNLKANPDSTDDLLAQARVDAAFPTPESQASALKLLTELDKKGNILQANDRIVLARLRAPTDWQSASQIFRDVVAESKSPAHLAAYVDSLLAHKENAEAETWLERLEELDPKSPIAHELRTRLRVVKGQYEEAFNGIVARAETGSGDPKKNAESRRLAATQLSEIGDYLIGSKRSSEANRFYDQAEKYLAGQDSGVELIRLQARRGHLDQAITQLKSRKAKLAEGPLGDACIICAAAPLDKNGLAENLYQVLKDVTAEKPSASAWLALASVQDRLGKYDEEEQSYRNVLAIDEKRVEALNNLAYVLAQRQKDLGEARTYVEKAIAQTGPFGALVDTRAMVGLAEGKVNDALIDSEKAVENNPTPMHLFHRAKLLLAAGQRQAARDSWKKAVQAGLKASSVHPLEAKTYEELAAQLQPQGS